MHVLWEMRSVKKHKNNLQYLQNIKIKARKARKFKNKNLILANKKFDKFYKEINY